MVTIGCRNPVIIVEINKRSLRRNVGFCVATIYITDLRVVFV